MASYCASKLMDELTPEKLGAAAEVRGMVRGRILKVAPLNQQTSLELDMPLGKASGVYFGLLFQLSKWGFDVNKVFEWTEISPVHAQFYQLTVQQKQQLEAQIKSALLGISTAVGDYELLNHDLRKYEEYMRIFEALEKAEKDKDEKIIKEKLQTLRSIFIDQVDVHTGEGVALKLIAARWPTIIVDFARLKESDTDPKKISSDYNVTEAEGFVLATKNKLFAEWKRMFNTTVQERFERLKQLVEARKKSIDEYKQMVKPYITRFKSIRELGETEEGRGLMRAVSWFRPSTQAVSLEFSEIWAWKPFMIPELHKAYYETTDDTINIMKSDLPQEFKKEIKDNWDLIKDKHAKIKKSPTGIEPLDKWVLYFRDKLQEFYRENFNLKNVTLTTKDLLDVRDEFISNYKKKGWIATPYFQTMEIPTFRIVMRFADGQEMEVLILGDTEGDKMLLSLDTQNVILVRMLELKIKEKEFESYISEMLGETGVEGKKIEDIIKEQYPYLKGGETGGKKNEKPASRAHITLANIVNKVARNVEFLKPGNYEVDFIDRMSSTYFKEMASFVYVPIIRFIKNAAGFP